MTMYRLIYTRSGVKNKENHIEYPIDGETIVEIPRKDTEPLNDGGKINYITILNWKK